jgi:uncharacterized membrane protein
MSELIKEEWLHGVVSLLVRLVEAAAAIVIFSGAAVGFVLFVLAAVRGQRTRSFERIRLTLGRFLALGLEFQLGSDLLRTAVAPSWQQIGQLAAVAAIRTALNYFLGKEIREEQRREQLPEARQEQEGGKARAEDTLRAPVPAGRGGVERQPPVSH